MGSVSISISPSPGVTGQDITIDTSGLPEGHELELDWYPEKDPRTVKVDGMGRAVVTVPAGAATLVVRDPESEAEAATGFRQGA